MDERERVFREVVARHPAVAPVLRRLAARLARTGALAGQMTLGVHPPRDVLDGLERLVPGAALQKMPTGRAILWIDRLGVASDDAPAWIAALCAALDIPANVAPASGPSPLATMRDRCRLAYPDLAAVWDADALRTGDGLHDVFRLASAVRFLTGPHEPLGLADLGARCFGDSKALKQSPALKRRLAEWLRLATGDAGDDESQIWVACGVLENPTATRVTIFGPLIYWKDGVRFDWMAALHARGETATLAWDNLQGIDGIDLSPGLPVTTCENETPFAALVRQRESGLLIYTAGYPNAAVTRLLSLLPTSVATIRHWGDTDTDGLNIAALLHRVRPVRLWRCGIPDIERHRHALRPLAQDRRRRAEAILAGDGDFPFRTELGYALAHGWLEQECWRAAPEDGSA